MPQRLKRRSEAQPETSTPRLPTRQRRAQQTQHESESESESEAEPEAEQEQQQQQHESDEVSEAEEDGSDADNVPAGAPPIEQMVKKLVRLALATEFSRLPLRRGDIGSKVLDPHVRSFKPVFAGAQKALQSTFGMKLVELPSKEKVTIAQKRAAQRAAGGDPKAASQGAAAASASSKSWVLTSTLPSVLRSAAILAPTRNPSAAAEAEYVGLYTFVVSTIYLSQGGRVSEGKLERYLQRLDASEYVMGGVKTEEALKRMEKHGYIVKVREREAGGEETIDWMLGPRGKVEIGERGVAGMVRTVYGKTDVDLEELENKLERSLGPGTFRRKSKKQDQAEVEEEQDAEAEAEEEEEEEEDEQETERQPVARTKKKPPVKKQPTRPPARRGRSQVIHDEAEEDNDEEEEEEEEEEDSEETE